MFRGKFDVFCGVCWTWQHRLEPSTIEAYVQINFKALHTVGTGRAKVVSCDD